MQACSTRSVSVRMMYVGRGEKLCHLVFFVFFKLCLQMCLQFLCMFSTSLFHRLTNLQGHLFLLLSHFFESLDTSLIQNCLHGASIQAGLTGPEIFKTIQYFCLFFRKKVKYCFVLCMKIIKGITKLVNIQDFLQ